MGKLRKLSTNEKMLIAMLVLAVILVFSSWDRITEKTQKVLNIYTNGKIETKK